MTKKEDAKKKELKQLSIEFPSCNKMHDANNGFEIKDYLSCSTPVIRLSGNSFLCKKDKANYINLVLSNTKSF
ncbi:MAG: hypothetical protein ACPG6B_00950 [Oceanihabitans sp.]